MRRVGTGSQVIEALGTLPTYDPDETGYALYVTYDRDLLSVDVFPGQEGSVRFPFEAIVSRAKSLGAYGVIAAHTHPSGEIYESREDIAMVRSMRSFLLFHGLTLVDSLIFKGSKFHEFARYY